MWIAPRLRWHTLIAAMMLGSFVVAPLVLLLRGQLGMAGLALGMALLTAGSASLLGAALCRAIDRSACTRLQWHCIIVAAWVMNPVLVVLVSLCIQQVEVAWWSGVPFAFALMMLSGRLRLVEGDPDWVNDGCGASMVGNWICSRLVFIGIPMCLLSFQVALYLPEASMLPQGPEIGLFICGGCVLISAKFCAMCACLARQKNSQALVLVVLLSADWISSLHLMLLIGDELKTTLLLCHLLVAGLIQLRAALVRLRLRQRWARARLQRQAREAGAGGVDAELGAQMTAGAGAGESTDSDDERGPGSLPDGFHEALVSLFGVPPANAQHARQWLCGVRRARVREGEAEAAVSAPAPSPTADGAGIGLAELPQGRAERPSPAGSSTSSPTASGGSSPQLEVPQEERICTVCQEEIKSGDTVRPLPKCSHVFHAACLESWAKTMREATTCPTCRRPALARKQAEGSTSIAVLAASASNSEAPQGQSQGQGQGPARGGPGSGGRGSGRLTPVGGGGRGARRDPRLPPRPPRPGGPRAGRGDGRAAAALRLSLGVSEAMAQAALEAAGGAPDVAAHLLLEHRALLARSSGRPGRGVREPPPGVLEATVQANPDLAGSEAALRRQLGELYGDGGLQTPPWEELTPPGRAGVFRALLEDVVRRLDERA